MRWNEIVIGLFNILLMQYVYIKCYELINKDKVKSKRKIIIVLVFSGILSFLNLKYNLSVSRMAVSFLILSVSNKIIFDEPLIISSFKTLIVFLVTSIVEILMSVFVVVLNITELEQINKMLLLKTIFSISNVVITYLFFKIKKLSLVINKIVKKISDSNKINIIEIVFLLIFIVILIIMFEFIYDISFLSLATELAILVTFLIFLFITVYQFFVTKKSEEKEKVLLDFMSKYEKIIDDDRINRHEMLNNLLIIKSFKNRNTIKFEETLNEIISLYTSKGQVFSNLYNLPSGLKGLLYYKIHDMKTDDIDVTLNISTKTYNLFEMLDEKLFFKVCKIIGILLDNAREASKISEEKKVIIDMYKENNYLTILIENSCNNIVDLNKINEKSFSTKGKGRGLGLYVTSQILSQDKRIKLYQDYSEKVFSSILKINNTIKKVD